MSDPEDLEDGEIEDDEDDVQPVDPPLVQPTPDDYKEFNEDLIGNDHVNDQGNKGGQRASGKPAPVVDDWASRVENAIADALIKDGVQPPMPSSVSHATEMEEEMAGGGGGAAGARRSKKRKKSSRSGDGHHHASNSKQQRLDGTEEDADADLEYEMMNVRGVSPQESALHHRPMGGRDSGASDSEGEDTHYSSDDSRDRGDGQHFRGKSRGERDRDRDRDTRERDRERERDRDRERDREYNRKKRKQSRQRGNNKPARDGRKRRRDDSDDEKHRPTGPRKMELCKFYLMDCCAKREKCLYMHKDFPCKYYYLGMKCKDKEKCLFSHGEPLTDDLRAILLKHLETAPQEILGDFQRISRDCAIGMVNATHRKLLERYGKPVGDNSKIPSLLDVPTVQPSSGPGNSHHSQKYRKSRWTGDEVPGLDGETLDLLKQLTGVISPRQAQDLERMGIRTLDEISQLTVAQLNELGLSITQIHDLQVRAMNVQKKREAKQSGAGLAGNNGGAHMGDSGTGQGGPRGGPSEPVGGGGSNGGDGPAKRLDVATTSAIAEDLDLRKLPPPMPAGGAEASTLELGGSRDVDMRVLPAIEQLQDSTKDGLLGSTGESTGGASLLPGSHNLLLKTPTVDYSQYIKDSNLDEDLDAVAADTSCLLNDAGEDDDDVDDDDDENHLKINIEEEEEEEKKDPSVDGSGESSEERSLKRTDSGIEEMAEKSLLLPPLVPPKIDYAQGLGDILMYGSLDKSSAKSLGGGAASPKAHHRSPSPGRNEGSSTAASRAALLQDAWTPSMADSPSNTHTVTNTAEPASKAGSHLTKAKNSNDRQRRPGTSSIYDWYDSDNVPSSPDGPSSPDHSSLRSGVDGFGKLGPLDLDDGDAFGSGRGDREASNELGFPFKSMMGNYVPAKEIDGSTGSHAPITYKVYVVDVPKPNYKVLRRTIARPVPSKDRPTDPRLRRLFGIQSDEDETADDGTSSDAGIKSPDGSTPGASPLYNNPPSAVPPSGISSSAGATNNLASVLVNNKPPAAVSSGPRVDPRKRHAEKQQQQLEAQQQQQQQQTASSAGGAGGNERPNASPQMEVQAILQKSAWYKDLGSKHKIMVNQQLAILSTEMKKYHNSDRSTERLSEFMHFLGSSNMLQHILSCLNVFVDDSVSFCEVPVVPNLPPPLSIPAHIPPPSLPLHVPPPLGVQGGSAVLPGAMSLPPPLPAQQGANPAAMFGLGTNAPPAFGRPPMQDAQPPLVVRPGLLGVSPNMPFEQFLAMGNVNKGGDSVGNVGSIAPWTQGNVNNNAGGGGGNNGGGGNMRNMRNNNRIGHNFRNNNDRWNNNGGGVGGGGGGQMMMGGNNNGGQGNNRRNNRRNDRKK